METPHCFCMFSVHLFGEFLADGVRELINLSELTHVKQLIEQNEISQIIGVGKQRETNAFRIKEIFILSHTIQVLVLDIYIDSEAKCQHATCVNKPSLIGGLPCCNGQLLFFEFKYLEVHPICKLD